jgi:hypothetical protein
VPEVIEKPPAADNIQYELKDVQTLRGTEARTAAKWAKDGWELVSQSQGTLRTTLSFRRVKPKAPWRWMALAGGAMVLIIGVGVAVESQGGDGASTPAAASAAAATVPATEAAASAVPSAVPAATLPSQQVVTEPGLAVGQAGAEPILTAQNNPDLAALLALSQPNDATVAQFAATYQGQSIEFDGNVANMANHGSYDTRYDILIGAGDYSTTSSSGPNFQFQDVNTTSDLHFVGTDVPDFIGTGDNLHITAEVVGYNSTQELFFLEPISTQFR